MWGECRRRRCRREGYEIYAQTAHSPRNPIYNDICRVSVALYAAILGVTRAIIRNRRFTVHTPDRPPSAAELYSTHLG